MKNLLFFALFFNTITAVNHKKNPKKSYSRNHSSSHTFSVKQLRTIQTMIPIIVRDGLLIGIQNTAFKISNRANWSDQADIAKISNLMDKCQRHHDTILNHFGTLSNSEIFLLLREIRWEARPLLKK